MGHREEILDVLRRNPDAYISGEELAQTLGVSRTMIWKYFESLRQDGFVVESVTNRGYRLVSAPDLLLKDEVQRNLNTGFVGKQIYYFDEIDSTNRKARELAPGCPDGTIILAERQSEGRGRMGKEWYSPQGGIWLSIILKPDISPEHIYRLTLVAGVAVVETLVDMGIAAQIKWPNDILINEKKVCGILTEVDAEMDAVNFVIVGIGINANIELDMLPPLFGVHSTSLKSAAGSAINRVELVQRLLERFEQDYGTFMSGDFDSILKRWREHSATLNRRVRIVTRFRTIVGEAVGIDHDGALVVEMEDGTLEREITGSCVHL
ncbi:MAG: biotin--[acetyl-CoA-carboxylase] ligase [Methanosarcinales archaeon]|nr:biotin--[acetyl-CoA-carboxylase] ligase [Methanosarcinales archaeon]